MKKLIVLACAATAAAIPTAAQAQALPAAVIAVVDLNKVTSECNACKTASATLRSQVSSLQAREKSLSDSLNTEAKAIQTAADALKGKEPDAALRTRVQAFETKRQNAASEIEKKRNDLQRLQGFIQQQIGAKLQPIYEQVMVRRGANIMLEMGSTLATASSVEITADVTAALNAALPSISTNPPAQPAAPQGR